MSEEQKVMPPISLIEGLGSSQLEVLNILWRMGRATVRQVFDEVRKTRSIMLAAIQISMKRLTKRGILRQEPGDRGAEYEPAVSRHKIGASFMDELVDKVFAGAAVPVLSKLVDKLSDKERQEFAKLLEGNKR